MGKFPGVLIQNSILAFAAKIVYQFGNAFLFFLIARFYGSEEAGIYTLAVRYHLIFLTLAIWGLDGLLIWRVAADHSVTLRYIVNYSLLRLLSGIVAYVLLALAVSNVRGYNAYTIRVIMLLALGLVPEGLGRLAQAVFMAHQRFMYPVIVAIIVGITRCGLGGLVVWSHGGLETLALVHVWSSLLGLGMYTVLLFLRRYDLTAAWCSQSEVAGTRWRQLLDWNFMRRQIGLALPFMLMDVFLIVEGQIDIVVLSLCLSQSQVGIYGAAQTIVLPLSFALYAYHAALYPFVTRLYASNQPYLWALYQRLFSYTGLLLIPVAIILTVSAQTVVNLVYHTQFIAAATVVPWLVWSVVLQFLNEPNSRLIVAAGHQKTVTILLCFSMMTNVLLNCLLIPKFGILGSAWARLFSTLLFTLSNGITVFYRINRINLLPIVGKPILGAFVWGGILHLCWPVGMGIGLILGGMGYLLVLFLTGAISIRSLRHLRQTICALLD